MVIQDILNALPLPAPLPVRLPTGKIVFANEVAFTFKTGCGHEGKNYDPELRDFNRKKGKLGAFGREWMEEIAQLPIYARVIAYETDFLRADGFKEKTGGAFSAGVVASKTYGTFLPVLKNGAYEIAPVLAFDYLSLKDFETPVRPSEMQTWDGRTPPVLPNGILTAVPLEFWMELVSK
jgi:hypothetical protein